jgi:hypothetical protein
VKHIWLVSNVQSGSTSEEKCDALRTVCHEKRLHFVGNSRFPDEPPPDAAMLHAAGADTVLLFAGDGTINATLRALEQWYGDVLILPGGTMNLLAKMLHGDAGPADIIHRVHREARRTALPYLQAAHHRAYVASIIGPAAHWAKAREAVREGSGAKIIRYGLRAWRRMFSEKVRIAGVPRLTGGYQAIFASVGGDLISLAAVDARDWRQIAELGWDWICGDWVAARAVTSQSTERFIVAGSRPVLALLDGEPRTLAPGTSFTLGRSAEIFLTTCEETE